MIDPTLLLRWIAAHLIADFSLQPDAGIRERREKGWKSRWLYIHGAIYAGVVFASSGQWGRLAWLFPVVFASHVVIDGLKSGSRVRIGSFLLDQAAHLLVLFGLWLALSPGAAGVSISLFKRAAFSEKFLLITAGGLFLIWPSGKMIGLLTEPLRRQIRDSKRGLEGAGFWIGCLERAFVFSFVMVGAGQGIVILAGAKSLFRFGEIKDPENRKETEYILIGSLLSFGLALAVGLGVKAILGRG
jgi:hypothetical protein